MEGKEAGASRPANSGLPYREDCWSEGETSALVDAWGDRYLELNRGHLRQKHWQEVADAVNSRRGATGRRQPRTDVQCKNRIDTLKKKYKVEKGRIGSGSGAAGSQWPFFARLDALVGSSASAAAPAVKKRPLSPPLALPLPYQRKGGSLPVAAAAAVRPLNLKDKRPTTPSLSLADSIFQRAAAAAAAAEEDDYEEYDEDLGSPSRSPDRSGWGWKRPIGDGDGIRELAKAMVRFSEIYERVEVEKQQQTMEIEKKRMEFAKELEIRRMQMLVDSQVQLVKIKRAKRADTDGYMENLE
ncbi:trihelix transcription factor ASIL1-like [Zingiber officinale]|uniref:trihelix transcription factor ASIL1-like n=1 Tax=Zingiber officinale TaxID=94328 RepID=UPI001C4CFCD2|nr:trihelix transcription factor ASIL1-like [Zingiber officinale]XP_042394897.1 trihelix transcription factor ASIL1-like [Zingiber officinale]